MFNSSKKKRLGREEPKVESRDRETIRYTKILRPSRSDDGSLSDDSVNSDWAEGHIHSSRKHFYEDLCAYLFIYYILIWLFCICIYLSEPFMIVYLTPLAKGGPLVYSVLEQRLYTWMRVLVYYTFFAATFYYTCHSFFAKKYNPRTYSKLYVFALAFSVLITNAVYFFWCIRGV